MPYFTIPETGGKASHKIFAPGAAGRAPARCYPFCLPATGCRDRDDVFRPDVVFWSRSARLSCAAPRIMPWWY